MKIECINPSTEEVLKAYSQTDYAKVLPRIKLANQQFKKWSSLEMSDRLRYIRNMANILREQSDKLATIASLEMGKPLKEAKAEVEKCAWLCDYFAQNSEEFLKDDIIQTDAKKSYATFQPLGVILGIMPWNFPYWQVFRFVIPAMCAGNVCLVKHASNVPQCLSAIDSLFTSAGLPLGTFTPLLIDSKTTEKIISSELVQAVSLTGSLQAGKEIGEIAGRNIKKIVLELGGSDPFIVLDNVDIQLVSSNAVKSRLINSGQSCIAAKRFIVVNKHIKEFQRILVNQVNSMYVGDALDKKTDVGPLAKKSILDNLDKQVKDAVKKGASLLCGGYHPNKKGYYYMPTVLANVTSKMRVYKEEVFGPVFAIIPVKDEAQAIEVANDSLYGLGASIWCKNIKKAESIAAKLEVGSVFINDIVHSDARLPFGGIKQSGYGRELGSYGIKEFVNIKTISINNI